MDKKPFVKNYWCYDEEVYDPRKIIGPGKEAIIKITKVTMDMFGSTGKAIILKYLIQGWGSWVFLISKNAKESLMNKENDLIIYSD